MDVDVKFLFKENHQKIRFYDLLSDIFTEKCGDTENDLSDGEISEKYWNLMIENRQETVEYFSKCVGVAPKAGANEGESLRLKTNPLTFTRPSSCYGYKQPLKHQWPAYVAGSCINGAVAVDLKGYSESLTFCINVTHEATHRTMSRSMQEEDSEKTEVLFSKTYTSASFDIKCGDPLFSDDKDRENISAYKNGMLVFPYKIAIDPKCYPSIQPLGGNIKVSLIHALYARIRIYSQEGVLKTIKQISTGLLVEPRPHRSPIQLLTSNPLVIRRDFFVGLFGTSGKISCELTLPRNYFTVGEIMEITVKVINESSQNIERLEVNVSLEGEGEGHSFTFSTKPVYGPGVAATIVKEIQLPILVTFTSAGVSDCLLPVSCGNYGYMKFLYNLNVNLVRAGFRKNIQIHVPVYLTSKTHFF